MKKSRGNRIEATQKGRGGKEIYHRLILLPGKRNYRILKENKGEEGVMPRGKEGSAPDLNIRTRIQGKKRGKI